MLARQYKIDGLVSRESAWVSEEVKGCQAPVDAIEAEVFGQPVLKLIFSLLVHEQLNVPIQWITTHLVQILNILDMLLNH